MSLVTIKLNKAITLKLLLEQSIITLEYAQIAQLVEQRTENPRVAGSIPALGTERRKASVFRLCYIRATSSVGRALDF